MAMTNAERQAAHKARRAEMLEMLTQQNAALLAEVAELRAELNALKEKAHRMEVAALKAQLKRAEAPAEKTAPAQPPAKKVSRAPRQK